MISFTAETCPAPPSISRRSGQASVSRSGSSFSRRWNRRVSTSFIIPKSSPGVRSSPRMLNLRYCDFTKPSGPATIIAPTALVPWMWELS
jgi:hypothetical protein